MIALPMKKKVDGGFPNYIPINLEGQDLEEVFILASNISKGPTIKPYQIVGAAGQVLVRKVFPQLAINGQKFLGGDQSSDYIDRKIDTKTSLAKGNNQPHLWLRRDMVCDRACDRCFADKSRCRSLKHMPPRLFVGVEMDPYEESTNKWAGRVYGFCTTRRLQELYRDAPQILKYSNQYNSVGFPASLLCSMPSLFYYLRNRHNTSSRVHEYFSPADMDVMDECFG